MAITANGTAISKVVFNGTTIDKVIFNGVTVYTSAVTHTINSVGASYNGATYPNQYSNTTLRVGTTSSANQGVILAFPVTAAQLQNATTDATITLNFSSSNYLTDVLFIAPDKKVIPQLASGQTGTTAFSTFKAKATTKYSTSTSGSVITLTIPKATLQSWKDYTVTINGATYVTIGLRCNYNAPYVYRLTNTMVFTSTV